MFYSKTTNGFYDEAINGARKLDIPDPHWEPPLVEGVADPEAIAPTIQIDNPTCGIPSDAVGITDAEYTALLAANSAGKVIGSDAEGKPVAVEPPPASVEEERKVVHLYANAFLHETARDHGFSDMTEAATYADEPSVRELQVLGAALRAWRSQVKVTVNEIAGKMTQGEIAPTEEEVLSALPAFIAP